MFLKPLAGLATMNEKFYITTPIYYVNDKPHIGHAYTTILADILARYHRLLNIPTFFLTGTDEHGLKVQQAAVKNGMEPQKYVDIMAVRFAELWKKIGISNDDFIRTTEVRHKCIVQEALQYLYDKGEIYKADYDGWYCVACERFYVEKDIRDFRCPEPGCNRELEQIREPNYFFKMGKYRAWLVRYIEKHPGFIRPDFRRNETLGFLQRELNDLCISRPKNRLAWGIELPFDTSYVTYVWFDALMNYVTAVGYRSDPQKFKLLWPVSCHLIGKDILTTHSVYWPIMLYALDLPMPECIFAHGWWLVGTEKMSKSKGNVIDPMTFIDDYGVDAFRYFLASEMVMGQDASFTEDLFLRRYNADLANDLGNLLNRVVRLIHTEFKGQIPQCIAMSVEEDDLQRKVLGVVNECKELIKQMRVDLIVDRLRTVIRETNRYVEKRQPWTLAQNGNYAELAIVLYTSAEVLRIICGMLHPIMPSKMEEALAILGYRTGKLTIDELQNWGGLKGETQIGEMKSLFPRVKKQS